MKCSGSLLGTGVAFIQCPTETLYTQKIRLPEGLPRQLVRQSPLAKYHSLSNLYSISDVAITDASTW